MDEPSLHPALTEVLRAERESLNQRFKLRERSGAKIDGAAFQEHLRTTVNGLVAGVAKGYPERVRAVVNALFDVSLDLFAAGLLGPVTKHPHVGTAWREVLPQAISLLARDPVRVVGCLSNAVEHLAAQTSARPSEWIERIRDVSGHCDSVPRWLDAGKVAAWRAGMVQYRADALRIARELPWELAARCVGAQHLAAEPDWRRCMDRLQADRWYTPAGTAESDGGLRLVRMTGGFRGFGGPCLRPPTVTGEGGSLFVSDGHATWQLLADAFGTAWHRVADLPVEKAMGRRAAADFRIDSQGNVTWDGVTQFFPELAEPSSSASDGQTLAVTLVTSHHVFLVAHAAR